MADKKKLTDKEKEDIAFKNMAIDYIGQLHSKVSEMEQIQAKQIKYRAKQAKSKARAKKAKAAKKTRNLTGLAKFPGFQGFLNKNPMDK